MTSGRMHYLLARLLTTSPRSASLLELRLSVEHDTDLSRRAAGYAVVLTKQFHDLMRGPRRQSKRPAAGARPCDISGFEENASYRFVEKPFPESDPPARA
jgi:hypothetical protein